MTLSINDVKELLALGLSIHDVKELFSGNGSVECSKQVDNQANGQPKIVILQRGWIAFGRFFQNGSECRLENATIIRNWGTTRGLGEIAKEGPTSKTKLDPCPPLDFHELTTIARMDVNEEKWLPTLSDLQ